MALSTYAELQAAIADHLDRSGLDSQIPDFIRVAEARMQRKLRVQWMENFTSSIENGSPLNVTGIANFLTPKMISVTVSGEQIILNYVPPSVFVARYPFGSNGGTPPIEYTEIANNIFVGPDNGSAYTWTIWYYQIIPPLSSTPSNWLLLRHPDVYLYGSLIAAEMYLKDPQEMPKYIAMYEQGLKDIQDEEIKDRPRGTAAQFNEMGAV